MNGGLLIHEVREKVYRRPSALSDNIMEYSLFTAHTSPLEAEEQTFSLPFNFIIRPYQLSEIFLSFELNVR